MAHELFYTSVPKGLQPGKYGFCTVAHTQGMSPALMQKLESLSGYKHLYPPLDPKAHLNPVAWSHLKVAVQGRPFHVLSRVSAAGVDYSERSNKFAHHVVLEAGELPKGGPAWLMQQPGFLETAWAGEPRVLPGGRGVPAGNVTHRVCRAWAEAAGDAGWAGVVAEAALNDPHRVLYVVGREDIDALPLFAEALALLPHDVRWQVTFSTYYATMPSGVTCAWRWVLPGSAEAKAAANAPGALVVDLTRPLGAAQGGPLVDAARSGEAPPRLSTAKAARVQAPAAVDWPEDLMEEPAPRRKAPPVPGRGAVPPPVAPPTLSPAAAAAALDAFDDGRPRRRGGDRSLVPYLMTFAAGTFFGGILVAFCFLALNTKVGERQVAQATKPEAQEPARANPVPTRPAEGGSPVKPADTPPAATAPPPIPSRPNNPEGETRGPKPPLIKETPSPMPPATLPAPPGTPPQAQPVPQPNVAAATPPPLKPPPMPPPMGNNTPAPRVDKAEEMVDYIPLPAILTENGDAIILPAGMNGKFKIKVLGLPAKAEGGVTIEAQEGPEGDVTIRSVAQDGGSGSKIADLRAVEAGPGWKVSLKWANGIVKPEVLHGFLKSRNLVLELTSAANPKEHRYLALRDKPRSEKAGKPIRHDFQNPAIHTYFHKIAGGKIDDLPEVKELNLDPIFMRMIWATGDSKFTIDNPEFDKSMSINWKVDKYNFPELKLELNRARGEFQFLFKDVGSVFYNERVKSPGIPHDYQVVITSLGLYFRPKGAAEDVKVYLWKVIPEQPGN